MRQTHRVTHWIIHIEFSVNTWSIFCLFICIHNSLKVSVVSEKRTRTIADVVKCTQCYMHAPVPQLFVGYRDCFDYSIMHWIIGYIHSVVIFIIFFPFGRAARKKSGFHLGKSSSEPNLTGDSVHSHSMWLDHVGHLRIPNDGQSAFILSDHSTPRFPNNLTKLLHEYLAVDELKFYRKRRPTNAEDGRFLFETEFR